MMARVLMTSVGVVALAGAAMVGPAAAQNRHGGGGGDGAEAAINGGADNLDIVGAGPTRNFGGLSAENDEAFRHDMRISGGEGREPILGSPSFEGRRFAGRAYYARDWGDDWRWRRFGRRGGWWGFGPGFGWGWGSPAYASHDYGYGPTYASYGYGGCTCGGRYTSRGWRRPYASVSRAW